METRTRQRITSSISLKVAIAGVVLVGVGAALNLVVAPLVDGGELLGAWSGITGLIGAYITLLSVLVFVALEILRRTGY